MNATWNKSMNPIVNYINILKEFYRYLCLGKPKGVIGFKLRNVPKGIDVVDLKAYVAIQLSSTTISKPCCPLVVIASSLVHDSSWYEGIIDVFDNYDCIGYKLVFHIFQCFMDCCNFGLIYTHDNHKNLTCKPFFWINQK